LVEQLEEEDEDLDPRLAAGWAALERGDAAAARGAARAVLAAEAAAARDAGAAGAGGGADAVDADAGADDADTDDGDADDGGLAVEALMLEAACDREEGNRDAAIETLQRAAALDRQWCTPELWLAELLALEEEDLGEALRHARRAVDLAEEDDEYLSALSLKAGIELDLGRPTEARRTLRGLPAPDVPLESPDLALEVAELLLETGDAAEARARLEKVVEAEPEWADAWYLLGTAAEDLEDEEAKRTAWLKSRSVDLRDLAAEEAAGADAGAGAPRLTEEALVAVAEGALAELPEDLRGLLVNVPIVVAEVPAVADVEAGLSPRLLGLFHGTPHSERGAFGATPALTEILLFRRNIERVARGEEETMRQEVRTTVLHEAGHFFGLDEDALARLGLD
jgi:predicted Zn-dependent protease with MMP-like domain/tetratricopeptide (TPR) repeat protein